MEILKIMQFLPYVIMLSACQPTASDSDKTAQTQTKEGTSAIPEPVKPNVPKPHQPQIILPPPIHLRVEKAIALKDLPGEARTVLELIKTGGPFPHPKKDGSEFKNQNRRLPEKKTGYYKEYIVPNAEAHLQNARRIITGAGGELYYTENRYKTFRPILKETVQ